MEEITSTSGELTVIQNYLMTSDNGIKFIKDVDDGTSIKVVAYLEFKDTKDDGKEAKMLSILGDDNNAYTTQSETFKESFYNIVTCMAGKPFSIIKISGETKSGREYVNCMLDKSSIL